MANQEQAPPQQEMAENPIPFTHATQVGFNLEDFILNTNNEVALLYPKHSNKEVFLSKALDNSKVSFSIPTSRIYAVLGVNTFRKAIGAHFLSHSTDYVDLPSIDIARPWGKIRGFDQIINKDAIILYYLANGVNIDYAMILWEDIINKLKKKNRENVVPYTRFLSLLMMQKIKDSYGDGDVTIHLTQIFSVNNWALKHNQFEGPPFIAHMMAICNAEKPMDFKAPRTSSHTEKKVSQGTKLGAKAGHKKQ
ncbi:hypothetical protein Tco_1356451 [Tanacetum coccineum]